MKSTDNDTNVGADRDPGLVKDRILLVDDDPLVLETLKRSLRRTFEVDTASSGPEGLRRLKESGSYSALVADMDMPVMDGLTFLGLAMQEAPETVRVMLTASPRQSTAANAVNEGQVFRFLTKPCSPDELNLTLRSAVQQHRVIVAEREVLDNTLNGSIRLLTEVLALVDPIAFGRSQAVGELARRVALRLGIRQPWQVELAGLLADIGLVSLPGPVRARRLSGEGLSAEEARSVAEVPRVSSELLANIPRLQQVAHFVLYKGKNFDGTGVPVDGVKGAAIPMESRILRGVGDLLDLEAAGVSREQALGRMRGRVGVYDPVTLEAMAAECERRSCVGGAGDPRRLGWVEVEVGQVLCENVTTQAGILVASAGTTISAMLLERLRHYAEQGALGDGVIVSDR